jgi:hypothetical protein
VPRKDLQRPAKTQALTQTARAWPSLNPVLHFHLSELPPSQLPFLGIEEPRPDFVDSQEMNLWRLCSVALRSTLIPE